MSAARGFVIASPNGWTWECLEDLCIASCSYLGVGEELPTKSGAELAWRRHRREHAAEEAAEVERMNRCRCNCCNHHPAPPLGVSPETNGEQK